MKSAITFVLAYMALSAFAANTKCTSGSDERVLALTTVETGCSLDYTKAGTSTTVATQKNGTAKCDEVLASIQGKLEAAGFKCEVAQ